MSEGKKEKQKLAGRRKLKVFSPLSLRALINMLTCLLTCSRAMINRLNF
jgi:hypothetical protein